jgi:hypothetical protein
MTVFLPRPRKAPTDRPTNRRDRGCDPRADAALCSRGSCNLGRNLICALQLEIVSLALIGKNRIIWRLAPFGAFGAVLPAISAVASRTDAFAFTPELNVLIGQIIYVASAALLAAIFPYGRQDTPFRATLVGICFPTIVGTALGATKVVFPTLGQARGGETDGISIVSWLVDAFSPF